MKPNSFLKNSELTSQIIGACIEVHRWLGPGLLESAYEECLCHELALRKLPFQRQKPIPVRYKAVNLDCGFRIDLLVADLVIIEIKAVETLLPIHKAQLLTHMKLTHSKVGFLINFNVIVLRQGLVRMVL
ncbi:MAG: GxxExxY protein [Planctomycetes bacterium]|nr:GxxExxY protein [Planctomycetota bacterium]